MQLEAYMSHRIVKPSHASNQAHHHAAATRADTEAVVATMADTADAAAMTADMEGAEVTAVEWEAEWPWGAADVRSSSPTFVVSAKPALTLLTFV